MDSVEALALLFQGKKVRKSVWDKGHYIFINENNNIIKIFKYFKRN